MIKKLHSKNQKGFALLMAIVITSILLVVSFVVADLSYKELVLTSTEQQSQIAFYMADSGAECALYWDLKNPSSPGVYQGFSAFDPSNNSGSVTCNNQTVTTGSQTVQTIPTQSSQIGGGGGGSVSLASLNFDFENGSVGYCPTNWTCTGDAVIASASDGQGCAIANGINGNQYLKAGCDYTTGTAQSETFILPTNIDHVQALRAGGADGPNSGWFVKKSSDGTVLCSAENGTDSDTFFTDNCTGLSGYAGTSVYVYVVDNQNSGWGKTYLDDIQLMDAGNNALSPGSSGGSSLPSIFQINFSNSCAIVTVTKSGGTTEIDSRGYNTCDPSVARRFERGITITY
jgi:hypothetical protein